jgi:murein tripeptide amidase MpaA
VARRAVDGGPARVVRVRASAEALARARARLEASGRSAELIFWRTADGSIAGAAPDATLAAFEAEGLGVERLFDTIAAYQAARRAGDARALAVEQPDGPAQAARVVVVDLGRSRRGAWLGDPETVLRRNDRYAAVLDAGEEADPESDLAARYAGRGLEVAAAVPVEQFAAASARFFPEAAPDTGEGELGKAQEGAYTSYEELAEGLQALAVQYPDLVRLGSIGQTYEGRELWAVKISAGASADDPDKPDVLVTGCYHAREWISVEVPYALAQRLPALYATDPRVRHLLDTSEVWIVPLVNPDGHAYSQTEPNHAGGPVRFWRKSRRPIDLDGDGRAEGVGVDLNRNHGVAWRLAGDEPYPQTLDDAGASDEPKNFNVYRGPAPDSEPEVRALNALTADPAYNFVARLDYHNFSQLVLFPLGYSPAPAPDHALLYSLGATIQAGIRAVHGVGYTLQSSYDLYLTTGSSTDYAYERDRLIAYTVELRPRSGNFDLDEEQIPEVVDENVPGALALIEWAAGPATVASVRATQGEVVVAALRWERSGAGRSLAADARQLVRPGPMRVEVTFTRPLASAPRLAFEAGGATFAAEAQPGEPARYAGDTWVAAVDVPAGGLEFVRLLVQPEDGSAGAAGFDADPSTVARYEVGAGHWQGLEAGVPDASYALGVPPGVDLPPTAELISPVAAPAGPDGLPSEVFLAGSAVTVSWAARDDRGIAEQRLEYSDDGGATFRSAAAGTIDAAAREVAWRTPARLSSAAVVLRLTVVDGAGNQTHASSGPIVVSRAAIARAPSYAADRLRVAVSPRALRRASVVQAFVDGVPVAAARVRWRSDRNRVILRGTLAELGLEVGRASRLRLVVDGVPTPAVEFVP